MAGIWNDPGFEPKRQYRWLFQLGKENEDVPAYICKAVTKPNFQVTEKEHVFLNHKFWYPGRVEWNEIEVTIVDPIGLDASQALMRIVQESGYNDPDELDTSLDKAQLGTLSKKRSVDTLGDVMIQQLNSEGAIIETWNLKHAWIKKLDFGSLSYEDDALVEVKLTLRYDWATKT